MAHLLESTRNYLKSSTKLGRRLSQYHESSGSEVSLQDPSSSPVESTAERKFSAESSPNSHVSSRSSQGHRPLTQNRLSSFFTLDSRRNSTAEDRATAAVLSRKIGPDAHEKEKPAKKNKTKSEKSRKSIDSRSSSRLGKDMPLQMPGYSAQEHRYSNHLSEEDVPRGRSPTLSMSHTVTTVASSYDTRPSDYPSMKQYQSHVWRRNLLEESIMHSLKLGYGERPRSASRHRSRSRSRKVTLKKKGSTRGQKTRDQALLAALAKDLPPCPQPEKESMTLNLTTSQEDVVVERVTARSMPAVQKAAKAKTFSGNSPYQLLLNPSTTNITHSYASFTLELSEHDAPRIMASSVTPNLFMIKSKTIHAMDVPRIRRDSNTRATHLGQGTSPRVLTGKTFAEEDFAEQRPTLTLVAAM